MPRELGLMLGILIAGGAGYAMIRGARGVSLTLPSLFPGVAPMLPNAKIPNTNFLQRPAFLSPHGLAFIKQWEGYRSEAYRDVAGLWTIGYGHLIRPGDGLGATSVLREDQASALLARDAATAERAVNKIPYPFTQNEFDAMVSLAYNIGGGAFSASSVATAASRGDKKAAADAFLLYKYAGGRIIPGLVNRRNAEKELYLAA